MPQCPYGIILETASERVSVQGEIDADNSGELPASGVARLLIGRGMTVASAESCTGGLLSATLTDVPGSSAYFPGGIIAYGNDVKRGLLGVRPQSIAEHGAVSGPVALEMAERVRSILGSDIGIAVTGIAGPGGGTAAKPVGTTFIAVVAEDFTEVQRFNFSGDRGGNRAASVNEALAMLALYLETHPSQVEAERVRSEVANW